MMNPQDLRQFVVIVMFLVPMIGCSSNPPATNKLQSDQSYNSSNDEYWIPSATHNIQTETDTFFCTKGESRSAYVCGTANSTTDYYVWCVSDAGEATDLVQIVYGPNEYYDPATGYYTAKIDFVAPITVGNHAYTFNLGTSTGIPNRFCNATICVLPNRNYTIDYNCQTGCDLFDSTNVSITPYTLLNNAYSGTHLVFSINNTNLPQSTVDYDNPNPGTGYTQYIISSGINPNFDITAASNKSYLVMVYDTENYPSASSPDANVAGATQTFNDAVSGSYKCGYSFVFVNRILSSQALHNLPLPLATHYAVVQFSTHELGHLRGRGIDITDPTHTAGHNGVGRNNQCVMFNLRSLTIAQQVYVLQNDEFCKGHQQILLNKHE